MCLLVLSGKTVIVMISYLLGVSCVCDSQLSLITVVLVLNEAVIASFVTKANGNGQDFVMLEYYVSPSFKLN